MERVRLYCVLARYTYGQILGLRQLEQRKHERKYSVKSLEKRTLPIGVSLSQASLSSGAPPRIVLVSFVRVYPGLELRLIDQLFEELG